MIVGKPLDHPSVDRLGIVALQRRFCVARSPWFRLDHSIVYWRLLRPGAGVMDSEFLKQQAAHCRFLAEKADPFIKRRLLDLAVRYDARLDRSMRGPPRTFGIPSSLLEALLPSQRDTSPN